MLIAKVLIACFLTFSSFSSGERIYHAPLAVSQFDNDADNISRQRLTSTAHQLHQTNRILRATILIVVILILIIALLLFVLYRKKKEVNFLENQKKVLRKQASDEIIYAEQLEEIIKELEKLSIVTRKSDNAIVIFDAGGEIDWVNEGFTQLYGYTYQEFIVERGYNIIRASYDPAIKQKILDCLDTKESKVYTNRIFNKYGQELWVRTTLTPVLSKDGKLKKLITIDTDITELVVTQEQLKLKQAEITESIVYARRIQQAMFPSLDEIKRYLPYSFLIYQPKDIVGGDFYWFYNEHNISYIAVADCTGHGVPGAFMSLIAINLLKQVVHEQGIAEIPEILTQLNKEIVKALNSNDDDYGQLEGMDIGIVKIDHDNHTLSAAAASQVIYFIHDGEFIEIKGERASLGSDQAAKTRFPEVMFPLSKGDSFYMFSDGFRDQFGGDYNKKFQSQRFSELIEETSSTPIENQQKIIQAALDGWMGENEQIDDIIVLGVVYAQED